MTIEQAVRERLLDIPALTALVGARVYQMILPQDGVLPAVRVQRISGMQEQQLRGPDGLIKSRVQVDAYAAPGSSASWYSAVTAIADAWHGDGLGADATGLFGWIGWAGGSPPVIQVKNVLLKHGGAPEYEYGERPMVRLRYDYEVHYWNYDM